MYYIIISHYCNRGFYFDVFFSITIMTMGEDVFICQNNAKMQKKKYISSFVLFLVVLTDGLFLSCTYKNIVDL